MSKPTAGIFGLTGCAGDQLAILNCEDRLLDIIALLDVRDFLMASSENDETCMLDVALVEGAVATARDREKLESIRKRSKLLIALGTCAVWGGIAAVNGGLDRTKLLEEIYGEAGASYDSLPPRPLRDFVAVDIDIPGCPIEKEQFLSALASLLNGDPPLFPKYPVCTECRMRENNCLLIEQNIACCGPLTVAGCGARCPELRVPCIGCRGPADDANFESALAMLRERGIPNDQIAAKLRAFAPSGVRV